MLDTLNLLRNKTNNLRNPRMTDDDQCHLSCEVDDIRVMHKALTAFRSQYGMPKEELERAASLCDIFSRLELDVLLEKTTCVD